MKRIGLLLALAAPLYGSPALADDDDHPAVAGSAETGDFDTKHIYGFTEGPLIGEPNEHEAEFTTTGHFLKHGPGHYAAVEQEATDEGALSSWFGYELTLHGAAVQTSGVTGLDRRGQANFSGVSAEPKFVLLRQGAASPVDLSLSLEPEWDRVDTVSGEHADNLSLTTRLMIDREFAERLYGAANLFYTPEQDHQSGAPVGRFAEFGASGALAWRFAGQMSLGGELQYNLITNSLGFSDRAGDALYLGPVFFVRVSPRVFVAGAWSSQIAGGPARDLPSYNQSELSRQKGRLTVSVAF
jgi:hypothetical protein